MKIKLVVVDLELSRRARRLAAFAGVGALALGASAIAYASVPVTWTDGDTLSAADLNGNFSALDGRVAALEQAPAPKVTDWVSYTPIVTEGATNAGTSALTSAWWRRVGDTMEVRIKTQFSSCASGGQLNWSLPPGVQFDQTKIAAYETMGAGQAYAPGPNVVTSLDVTAQVNGTYTLQSVAIEINGTPGGGAGCSNVGPGGDVRFFFAVPIQGWSVTGP